METSAEQSGPASAPEPTQKTTDLTRFAPLADAASKAVAALAITLYASGFLVLSLHHARYGFISTDPFRPRIAAAGAWFLFFSAIPIAVAGRYAQRPWIKIAESLFFIWTVLNGINIPLFYTLFENTPAAGNPYKHWVYWAWGLGGLFVLGVYEFAAYSKKAPRYLLPIASVATVAAILAIATQAMVIMGTFSQGYLNLWFMGVFLIAVYEFKERTMSGLFDAIDWSKPVATVLLILFLFAQYFYPHIKASWGGGTPINATIYFTKDSIIKPSQAVTAQLIEESDQGFYILGPKETKAVFVPRNAVALIYFSEKTSESNLLKNEK